MSTKMYTQKDKLEHIYQNCQKYIKKLIDIQTHVFPTAEALSQNPEAMDNILNLYRTQDMCYAYLLNPSIRTTGKNIQQLDATQILEFINHVDPVTIVDFFNQENVINDFIQANEIQNDQKSFQNDAIFQKEYNKFLNKCMTV